MPNCGRQTTNFACKITNFILKKQFLHVLFSFFLHFYVFWGELCHCYILFLSKSTLKKGVRTFALLSNICMDLFLLIVLIISPLSTGLCDESRNLLFYLYTLQSKTLTITNDVDVSITKYFLERRWQINVINKGRFFSRWKKICVILFPYICQKHPPLL